MARYNKMKVKKLYLGNDSVKSGTQNRRSTLVTATAAELNTNASATADNNTSGKTAILGTNGGIQFAGPILSNFGAGTAGTLVEASEAGYGARHITKLTMTATALPAIPGADAEAIGVLIYTFPTTGDIILHRAGVVAGITGVAGVAADEPDVGLGSVIATGDVATLDGTPAFEDIITGQTWSTGTMDGTDQIAHVLPTTGVDVVLTKGAHKVHFNVADTWAAASATNTITGYVWLEWSLRTY